MRFSGLIRPSQVFLVFSLVAGGLFYFDFSLETEVLLKDSEEVIKIPNPILLGLVWSSLVAALDGLFLSNLIHRPLEKRPVFLW